MECDDLRMFKFAGVIYLIVKTPPWGQLLVAQHMFSLSYFTVHTIVDKFVSGFLLPVSI